MGCLGEPLLVRVTFSVSKFVQVLAYCTSFSWCSAGNEGMSHTNHPTYGFLFVGNSQVHSISHSLPIAAPSLWTAMHQRRGSIPPQAGAWASRATRATVAWPGSRGCRPTEGEVVAWDPLSGCHSGNHRGKTKVVIVCLWFPFAQPLFGVFPNIRNWFYACQ